MTELFGLAVLTLILLIFLQAALHKLFDLAQLQGFVADYRLLPQRLVAMASYVLVTLESGVVMLAIFEKTRAMAIGLAMTLLGVYAFAIAVNLRRGRVQIECGCGGAAQRLGSHLIWRNLVLILIAAIPLLFPAADLAGVEIAFAMTAGFFLWLMYQFFEQAGANRQTALQRRKAS